MSVYDDHVLTGADCAVIYFADTDAAYIFIIVNGTDQNLSVGIRISFRRRDVIQDGLKKRHHILGTVLQLQHGIACLCGRIDKGAVQLLIRSVQIDEQFQHFIDDFGRAGLRTVDLVDADDDRELQFQGLSQHEFCLGHSSFKSIHYQDHPVYHFQDTFYFAAEIGMSGCVDNVDLCSLIINSSIFRKNGNSTLTFNIIGVHDSLGYFLIFAEYTALFEQLIYKRCFPMIDMGDNSNITYIFAFCLHTKSSFSFDLSHSTLFCNCFSLSYFPKKTRNIVLISVFPA